MTDEERAYSRGQCHAYNNVFKAFATAFSDRQDIHAVFERLTAQWHDVLATQMVREAS